jgi:Uncharacterised nucleotidyltransferase
VSTRSSDGAALLSLLRAFLNGERTINLDSLDDDLFARALDSGLGGILARVAVSGNRPRLAEVEGADLAARVLHGGWIDCMEEVLARCGPLGCRPLLLKGAAVALREYPEPHLRTMGDVDLLAPGPDVEPLERVLREMGFSQPVRDPFSDDDHHHSLPFFHRQHGVWIEVHTRLFPSTSPADREPALTAEALRDRFSSVAVVGRQQVAIMDRPLQLVYTAARWTEMISPERGIFPIVDAALVTRALTPEDWQIVLSLAGDGWTASALHLMLTFLDRHALAPVPGDVLIALAGRDRYSSRLTRRVLHAIVMRAVFDQRLASRRALRTVWATLTADMRPALKFPAAGVNVLVHPKGDRPLRLRRPG